MQLFVSIAIYVIESWYTDKDLFGKEFDSSAIDLDHHEKIEKTHRFIIYFLIANHAMSWVIRIFRNHDIKVNGKVDNLGVYSAPNESMVLYGEIILKCMLFGYNLYHLWLMSWD